MQFYDISFLYPYKQLGRWQNVLDTASERTAYTDTWKNTLKLQVQYVEIKCQLDSTEIFIADLIACSTCFGHHYARHQELKSIIQWLLPVVFRAVIFKFLVFISTY